eukprot:NODE_2_length_91304_cov_0.692462.p78 type:complete len:116 gc:universal NODE_2_length_91304_cov_0.692462:28280-28627(+)
MLSSSLISFFLLFISICISDFKLLISCFSSSPNCSKLLCICVVCVFKPTCSVCRIDLNSFFNSVKFDLYKIPSQSNRDFPNKIDLRLLFLISTNSLMVFVNMTLLFDGKTRLRTL